jgi:uncharacterized protein YkwD
MADPAVIKQKPSRHPLLPALALAGLVAAIAILLAPAGASAAGCPGADNGPRKISSKKAGKVVVCLVNKKRRNHGLSKLRYSRELARAARGHSKRMQKTDCFNHTCPGEAALTGRYQRVDYLPCGCSWGVGENIAWGPGSKGSPRRIVKSWMHSAPHRANILGSRFEHAGAGVRWGSPNRRGSHAGTYTLDFGYKR